MAKALRVRTFAAISLVLGLLILAGCSQAKPAVVPQPPAGQAKTGDKPAPDPKVSYVGKMTVQPGHGLPGTKVTVHGTGLPAGAQLQLTWNTVKGSWQTKGDWNESFMGRKFTPVAKPLQTVTTDASGGFDATFVVPQDYGFEHDVTLVGDGGVVRNQANFEIDTRASLSPASGPVGTPIEITLEGIGYKSLENSWTVLYDNKFTGWISSVTTGGIGKAIIPATGSPGRHVIQIIHGAFTVPFLNMQQSPQPDRPSFAMTFDITPDGAVQPAVATAQAFPIVPGKAPAGGGTAIWTDPVEAPINVPLHIEARGLPPGKTVDITWSRVKGSRVSGNGWAEEVVSLGKVQVDANGHAVLDGLQVRDDLGGPHRIDAMVDGQSVTKTVFTIDPSALPLDVSSGPIGTDFLVHLKGIGWTETANIYLVNYDNAYIGYACGFNSGGDISVHMKATGDPGWHYIDVYPGIYKGKDDAGVQNFRIPQLTAENDHPNEHEPIFHFAFKVTGK